MNEDKKTVTELQSDLNRRTKWLDEQIELVQKHIVQKEELLEIVELLRESLRWYASDVVDDGTLPARKALSTASARLDSLGALK